MMTHSARDPERCSGGDLSEIRRLATEFREAIERCPRERLPITFTDFPRGACGDAALLLAKYLERNGHTEFAYVLGMRGGGSHAWLSRGALIVDITADQFEDQLRPVIVDTSSGWHASFRLHPEDRNIRQISRDTTRPPPPHSLKLIWRSPAGCPACRIARHGILKRRLRCRPPERMLVPVKVAVMTTPYPGDNFGRSVVAPRRNKERPSNELSEKQPCATATDDKATSADAVSNAILITLPSD